MDPIEAWTNSRRRLDEDYGPWVTHAVAAGDALVAALEAERERCARERAEHADTRRQAHDAIGEADHYQNALADIVVEVSHNEGTGAAAAAIARRALAAVGSGETPPPAGYDEMVEMPPEEVERAAEYLAQHPPPHARFVGGETPPARDNMRDIANERPLPDSGGWV